MSVTEERSSPEPASHAVPGDEDTTADAPHRTDLAADPGGESATAGQAEATRAAPGPTGRWSGSRRTDLLAAVLSLAGALWLTGGAWADPQHRAIRINAGDQALFEWLLAYAAHAITHLHNPLWTDLINVPDGANLTVNTASTVHGVLLAPVTLLLGPPVAYFVALTGNLALSGYAWYWFFSRTLRVASPAALLGGLFCGYAPGVVSHANGHLNFTAQFAVPLILSRVLALPDRTRVVRNGLLLGGLVIVQYSLGAETLFFTALACAVLLACWLLAGLRLPRAGLAAAGRALALAAAVAVAGLAYPIWFQFFGPQTYHGTGFNQRVHSEDVSAYAAFPRLSLAGLTGLDTRLAPNPTEENSFFGPPLLLVVAAAVVFLLRHRDRRALVAALTGTGLVFAVLSFGPVVKFQGTITGIALPYRWLAELPLFDSALPARLALVVTPLIGAVLALALDGLLRRRGGLGERRSRSRTLGIAAIALALLPLVPTPVPMMARSAVPHFVSAGTWREYLRPGEALLPVPPTSDLLPDGQRWQATAMSTSDGATFRIPAGFFLGPGGPDGRGRIGPVPRPTQGLLSAVALTGEVPVITSYEQAQARDDLEYWRARVVVLGDGGTGNRWAAHHDALLTTVTALLGPGARVDDVWLWRVPG